MTPLNRSIRRRSRSSRRGAIIVKLAVTLPVIGGFAALGIDMTYLHNVHADLQRTADAAALAAAARLARETGADPQSVAYDAVCELLKRNPVGGEIMEIDPQDVVVGRAAFNDATGHVDWQGPSNLAPNAVEVHLRRTSDSPSGPVPLYFARMMGKKEAEISAQARAILIPRDISMVVDLSGSMNDDSELRQVFTTDINLKKIWDALGSPSYGHMSNWGSPLSTAWNPFLDPGLLNLHKGFNFTGPKVDANLTGYSAGEAAALKSKLHDVPSIDPMTGQDKGLANYINRTATVLGLAEWHSGMPGASFAGAPGGDGDNWIESNEMVWSPYPFPQGSWQEWIGSYMLSTSQGLVTSGAGQRFGLKTFMNYLLEARPKFEETPVLYETPEQPLEAVKDATGEIVDLLHEIDSGDQVSLEIYSQTGAHEVDLTHEFDDVRDLLLKRQAGHYDDATCIGCGVDLAFQQLTTGNARPGAAKVILLLTDGIANFLPDGTSADPDGAKAYVLSLSEQAAAMKVQIHCVGVGADADMELLQQVADTTGGSAFHAKGSVDEYSKQLREIFRTIGGKRMAVLIR